MAWVEFGFGGIAEMGSVRGGRLRRSVFLGSDLRGSLVVVGMGWGSGVIGSSSGVGHT